MATGDGPLGRLSAFGLSAGMATAAAALGLDPVRSLAAKILPDPGEGPGEEARAQGRFSIVLHTRTKQECRIGPRSQRRATPAMPQPR